MTRLQQLLSTTAALAFTTCLTTGAAAQQPQPNPAQPPDVRPAPQLRVDVPREDASITGELIKVDTNTKMLTIKTDEGKTEMVAYNDETRITGAQTGIAGLANQTNTKVTVKFVGLGPARVASEIVVEKDTP